MNWRLILMALQGNKGPGIFTPPLFYRVRPWLLEEIEGINVQRIPFYGLGNDFKF
jgi:hypothetical protein